MKLKHRLDSWMEKNVLPWVPNWLHPNHLTLARIGGVVLICHLNVLGWQGWAFGTFLAFALTDYFDGWLARAREQTTAIGKRLDELADKFIVFAPVVAMFALGLFEIALDSVMLWATTLAIVRESVITIARSGSFIRYTGVLWSARIKTVLQMVAVGVLLLSSGGDWMYWSGVTLFAAATGCALYSGYWYLFAPVDAVRSR